ncbi:hypothetical protein NCC49_003221 [Naganishia albida]|nr:hypothetical protein NCC49_003221 [Naganishia albida]
MFPPHPSKTPILPETTDEQDITLGMQDRKPLLSGSAAMDAGWAAVQAGNEKSATEREGFRVENDNPGKDVSGLCGDSGRLARGQIKQARVVYDPYLNSPIVHIPRTVRDDPVKHKSKKRVEPSSTESPSPPNKKLKPSLPHPASPPATHPVSAAPNAPFKHTPPSDPTLTGEAFYTSLLQSGQLRALDNQRFYCACRPAGWATERGQKEGLSHWQQRKRFCRARWRDHVRKCAEGK